MARKSARLPKRFPAGTTYVVQARGSVQGMTLVDRYVRLPDGRQVDLAARFVQVCEESGTIAVKPLNNRAGRTRAFGQTSIPNASARIIKS